MTAALGFRLPVSIVVVIAAHYQDKCTATTPSTVGAAAIHHYLVAVV